MRLTDLRLLAKKSNSVEEFVKAILDHTNEGGEAL